MGAGGRLFVRDIGAGPPVTLLHGGPGAQHDYLLSAFRVLEDEFHLYFYDQRGGGRSQVPQPQKVGWRDHVADLETLRVDWGLERLTIVGYSWGGLLALLYASEFPDRVRAQVLVAPAPGWGDHRRSFRKEFLRRSQSPEIKKLRAELEASGLRQSDPARYGQRRFDLSVAGYYLNPSSAFDSESFIVHLQAQQATWASLRECGADLRRKLGLVQTPTLVLHGRHDPIPLVWAEELARIMPRARLVVLENSGHVPYVEEADLTFGEIRRFLREHADS